MPRVDRVSADEWEHAEWSAPTPRVAVAWVAVVVALLGTAAFFGLRPDAWERYQTDFGCTALTNIDSSHASSRCKPPDTAARAQSPRHGEAR